jgi:hypothetical protein
VAPADFPQDKELNFFDRLGYYLNKVDPVQAMLARERQKVILL